MHAVLLLIIKFFNNDISDEIFQFQIFFYLVGWAYHEKRLTLNHSDAEVKFLSID